MHRSTAARIISGPLSSFSHALPRFSLPAVCCALVVGAVGCELPNTVCDSDNACADDFRCVHPGDGRAGLCKRTDEIPENILRELDGDFRGQEGQACLPDGVCDTGLTCDADGICLDDVGPDPEPAPLISQFDLDSAFVDNGTPIPVFPNTQVNVSWRSENADNCTLTHDGATQDVATEGTAVPVTITAEALISLTCSRGDRSATESIDGITFDEDALVVGTVTVSPSDVSVVDEFVTISATVTGYKDDDRCEVDLSRGQTDLGTLVVAPDAEDVLSAEFAVPSAGDVLARVTCSRDGAEVSRTAEFTVEAAPTFTIATTAYQLLEEDGGFSLDLAVDVRGATQCTFGLAGEGASLEEFPIDSVATTLTVTPQLGVRDYVLECFRNATSIAEHTISIAAVSISVPTVPFAGDATDPQGFVVYRGLTPSPAPPRTITFTGVGGAADPCELNAANGGLQVETDGTATLEVTATDSIFGVDENVVDDTLSCAFLAGAQPAALTVPFRLFLAAIDVDDTAEAVAGEDFPVVVQSAGMTECRLAETAPSPTDFATEALQAQQLSTTTMSVLDLSLGSVASVTCTDVFGQDFTVSVDFGDIEAKIVLRDFTSEAADPPVAGGQDHTIGFTIDIEGFRETDRPLIRCGMLGDEAPLEVGGNTVSLNYTIAEEPPTDPLESTSETRCTYNGSPFGAQPFVVQKAGFASSTQLSDIGSDVMVHIGGITWTGLVNEPLGPSLMLVSGQLQLFDAAAVVGSEVFPQLEAIGELVVAFFNSNVPLEQKCPVALSVFGIAGQAPTTDIMTACDGV